MVGDQFVSEFYILILLILVYIAHYLKNRKTPEIPIELKEKEENPSTQDPNSFSNVDLKTQNINLCLTADFVQKILKGHIVLEMLPLKNGTKVVLDSNFLLIENIYLNGVEIQ